MLADYLKQQGVECTVIRNDHNDLLPATRLADAIVLSPGPQRPRSAGGLMSVIEQQGAYKPMLGVCLGHQAIGEYFGAELDKAIIPRHGKVEEMKHMNHPLFAGIPLVFNATRYHSLLLKNLPPELDIIVESAAQEVMGISHKSLPLWGIQFHPESCATEFGLQLVKNFLNLAKQSLR